MKTKIELPETDGKLPETDGKLQQANEFFNAINTGIFDHRIKFHRQEVSNFLESFPELKEKDIYKYSVLLGFTHASDVVL